MLELKIRLIPRFKARTIKKNFEVEQRVCKLTIEAWVLQRFNKFEIASWNKSKLEIYYQSLQVQLFADFIITIKNVIRLNLKLSLRLNEDIPKILKIIERRNLILRLIPHLTRKKSNENQSSVWFDYGAR